MVSDLLFDQQGPDKKAQLLNAGAVGRPGAGPVALGADGRTLAERSTPFIGGHPLRPVESRLG